MLPRQALSLKNEWRKNMKKSIAIILALVMIFAFAATGAYADAEKVTVKFGNTQNENDLQSQSLLAVKEKLAEATDGNFVAECFFSSSLGETDDILEQALQGAPVLTVTDPSRLAQYVPDFGILGMPYLMSDYSGLDKIMQTQQYADWMKEFADNYGVWVVTSNWYSGARNFCLNKVVNKPEDLAGQRIRTIGNDICKTSVNCMGATATPMSWSEVYTSISNKALDGAEVQTSSFYATRLWEVVNTINRTEHFQLIGCAATGTGFRDKLSEDYQQLFLDTFFEVGTEFQAKTVETCAEWEKEMSEKYGLVINEDVDVDAFKEAAEQAYVDLNMNELRNRIQEEMAKVA